MVPHDEVFGIYSMAARTRNGETSDVRTLWVYTQSIRSEVTLCSEDHGARGSERALPPVIRHSQDQPAGPGLEMLALTLQVPRRD